LRSRPQDGGLDVRLAAVRDADRRPVEPVIEVGSHGAGLGRCSRMRRFNVLRDDLDHESERAVHRWRTYGRRETSRACFRRRSRGGVLRSEQLLFSSQHGFVF
jgi:hypothetical protein